MPFKVIYSLFIWSDGVQTTKQQQQKHRTHINESLDAKPMKGGCGLNALKMLNCPKLEHELSLI